METLDYAELLMEDQAWLDYLWDFNVMLELKIPSNGGTRGHMA